MADAGAVMPSMAVRRLAPLAALVVLLAAAYAALGPQQVVNALTVGSIYALIALGYTMVYGIIELINFAHGEVFMVGAYVAMWLLTNPLIGLVGDGAIADLPLLALVLLIIFTVTMAIMGVVGLLIERLAYRPLRNAPRLAPLITAIGVSFILQNVIQIIFGPTQLTVPQPIDPSKSFEFGGATVGYVNLFVVLVALLLMVGLQVFVGRTRLGRAMRSTAQDREAAQLMGVNINSTIAITFFIGSALAGAAGVVQGLRYGFVVTDLGFFAGLKAFTAAVLGGIGNTTGAALGGFIIGFVEVGAAQFGVAKWSEAAVFVVLIAVLVFRPSGLLGQQIGERA